LTGVFERNGLVIAVVAVLCVAAFLAGFVALDDPAAVLGAQSGPGAFYRLMPHRTMAALFSAAFLYALVAMGMGLRLFWRDTKQPGEQPADLRALWHAILDSSRLRYLDGGGSGCMNEDERPADRRKLYHHLTFYGFLLCFAATVVATLYHFLLGRQAPYPWYDIPVVLGTLGGIGLVIGPAGLLAAKGRRDPALQDRPRRGMDAAFIAMLLMTGVTGLALLVLRSTPAMGLLLALHLGMVFGFFITMPYGKFVHGLYRFAALIRYAKERRQLTTVGDG
jgi:citrate/tricarballylate utilization protein